MIDEVARGFGCPAQGAGEGGCVKAPKMKVQKKYYLPEETIKRVAVASAKSGFSQSAIVEACLTLHLVREATKRA